jgi:glutathione-regulated potassium-efflux system ancillary protein KefG
VARQVDPDDLIDAVIVAELLGLANRSSVSVYQKRYQDMPRPIVDLGQGRSRLWSRKAVLTWAKANGRAPIK